MFILWRYYFFFVKSLWSIGVMYYELLFGERPFNAVDADGIQEEHNSKADEKLKFPEGIEVTNKTKEFLLEIFINQLVYSIDHQALYIQGQKYDY